MTLQICIHEFLAHCRIEKNLSAKTIKAYQTDLLQLMTFLTPGVGIIEISRLEIRNYLSAISHLKPKSVKRKLSVMKAMFNHLEFEDKISINPFRKMKLKIKEEKKLPAVMSLKEISSILKKVYTFNSKTLRSPFKQYEFLRDILVIELLFNTGARVSEISNLKIKNVNLDNGAILIKGKGNKERMIHICSHEPIALLKKYCRLFNDKINSCEGFLLVNRFNNRLSDQSIRSIVKKYVLKAGIQRSITPHVFRHSFATLLLEKDVDLRYIQHFLGHSSITTTQLYTHVNIHKQTQILRTKHPRAQISMQHE